LSRILKPVSRPDAIDVPLKPLKHLLAQSVTVSRRAGRMVASTVALDSEDEAATLRMLDRKVNEVASYSNL
jgi:hypothetical protein